jgi:hypothetical protein
MIWAGQEGLGALQPASAQQRKAEPGGTANLTTVHTNGKQLILMGALGRTLPATHRQHNRGLVHALTPWSPNVHAHPQPRRIHTRSLPALCQAHNAVRHTHCSMAGSTRRHPKCRVSPYTPQAMHTDMNMNMKVTSSCTQCDKQGLSGVAPVKGTYRDRHMHAAHDTS